MIDGFVWIAFAVFADADDCNAFMEKHHLYEGLDRQCVIFDWRDDEEKLAPDTSLRPQARPTK